MHAQAEAREGETTKAAQETAVKAKAAADGRQRLAAEKKTLEQAQGALDSALLEVPTAPPIAFIFLCLDRSFQ